MNTISGDQKSDIEMMLNRWYNKECQRVLINHFSNNEANDLQELTLLQAKALYSHLGYIVMKQSKVLYVIALAYQNEMWDIHSPGLTNAHLKTFNHQTKMQFNKGIFELDLDELEEFIKPFESIDKARQEKKKIKQSSADCYQATKATNALLRSLSITKVKTPRKQAKKH